MSEEKARFANLLLALDALGPEIQKIARQLGQIQTDSEETLAKSLKDVASAAEENLGNAVKAAQETTRKEVLTELRARYLNELEIAVAEKSRLERRHETVIKQLETQKQELLAKLHQTEQAVTTLLTDLHDTRAEKQRIDTRLQGTISKLSEAEKIAGDLRVELRRGQSEKQAVETRLEHADAKRSEAEKAIARVLADSGQADAVKKEIETELQEAKAWRVEAEQAMARVRMERQAAQAEKDELELKLKKAEMSRSAGETDLQEAIASRLPLEREIQKLNAELEAARSQTIRTPEPAAQPTNGSDADGQSLPEKVNKEIERVEAMLAETMQVINDPDIALSLVMRKNTEHKELLAYLDGIRFITDRLAEVNLSGNTR